MERNFARALKLVLKHEGGYVNHPADPGGATNKGITIGTYRRYINKSGTVADLKAITDEQVATVYRKQYWDAVRGDDLPDGVDYSVFDFAVNSGPVRAAKYLQAIIGADQDGKIGPKTVHQAWQFSRSFVIDGLHAKRMGFLRNLKTWKTFGKGWTRRVDEVRAEAKRMAADASAPKPVEAPKPAPVAAPPAPVVQAVPAAPAGGLTAFLSLLLSLFKKG